jgi:hypothetical protein
LKTVAYLDGMISYPSWSWSSEGSSRMAQVPADPLPDHQFQTCGC